MPLSATWVSPGDSRLCPIHHGSDELPKESRECRAVLPHPQPEICDHLVIPTSSCVQFPCCFTNELLEVEGDTGQGLLLTHGPVRPAQANVLPHHPKSHPPCPRALVLVPPKSLPSLLRPPVLNSHLYRFQ